MSSFDDTNVLVRHLVGQPPVQAAAATECPRTETELFVVDLVIAETVYVLESFYEAPRAQVAAAIRSLVAMESVIVVDAAVIRRAAEVYETDRLDFARGVPGGMRRDHRGRQDRLIRSVARPCPLDPSGRALTRSTP